MNEPENKMNAALQKTDGYFIMKEDENKGPVPLLMVWIPVVYRSAQRYLVCVFELIAYGNSSCQC